jgi:hypothetical protein
MVLGAVQKVLMIVKIEGNNMARMINTPITTMMV